ncbi:MAG: hypothetical protein ACR2N6_05855, partial [Miltoncostaeaceae bacterium]
MVAVVRRTLAESLDIGIGALAEWRRDGLARRSALLAGVAGLGALALGLVALAASQSVLGADRIVLELTGATEAVLSTRAQGTASAVSGAVEISPQRGWIVLLAITGVALASILLAAGYRSTFARMWGVRGRGATGWRAAPAATVALAVVALAVVGVLFQSIGRLIALVDPGVPFAGTTIASLATLAGLFVVFLAVCRRGPRGPVG